MTGILALLAPSCARATGFVEPAWARDNTYRSTQAWWATSHALVMTQRIGLTTNIFTNRFLFNIAPTNFTSAPITNIWPAEIVVDIGTNGVASNRTYTAGDVQYLIQTNLGANWRAQIKWDCTQGADERQKGQGSESNITAGVRFYADDQRQLVYLKDILDGQYWVSPVAVSNDLAAGVFNGGNHLIWHFSDSPYTNADADIKAAANVGTNFFGFTPYNDLFFTNSQYKRVMTCAVIIATSSTNVITNTVQDCCGGTYQAIGTNRQRIVNVCTNANIDPGLNFSDYGYYALRRVLTNFSARMDQGFADTSYLNYGRFDTNTTMAEAIAAAKFKFDNDPATNIAFGIGSAEAYYDVSGLSTTSSAAQFLAGTNVFQLYSSSGSIAKKSASFDVFVGAIAFSLGLNANVATNYSAFNLGFEERTNGSAGRWFTFQSTNGWDGHLSYTSRIDFASLPTTNFSMGYHVQTIYGVYWFYGVPTNTPDSFRFR